MFPCNLFLIILATFHIVLSTDSSNFGIIQYSGVGYDGTFKPISKINEGRDGGSCGCELRGEDVWFTGENAPFSGSQAVHIRGPLKLFKFAYYTSARYVVGGNTSYNWIRHAYFDSSANTVSMENVTFLGYVGRDSECLGKSLEYVTPDTLGQGKVNAPPRSDTTLAPNQEYLIYSNISCPPSGVYGGCGVYRRDGKAFHGFGGLTKMFLFEFIMPDYRGPEGTDTSLNEPAIWLTSDSLPRVTQNGYSVSNCSCLLQGCGAVNVFSANDTFLDTSLITLQGKAISDDSERFVGYTSESHFSRPRDVTAMGGIIFDSEGNTVIFLSNETVFDPTIDATFVDDLLTGLPPLGPTTLLNKGNTTAPRVIPRVKSSGAILHFPKNKLFLFLYILICCFYICTWE